ncbi:hypothetical protein [Pseudoalteromonas sp. UBA6610]|uniref:hypothetical protein n=1 Tax=Pseudoalteromonas sp. UBA6610 TaxID=1947294 RepID=UPI0025926CCD|nr:hypothetical protein [Pseudoalteromonas sp. UBA6610]
MSFKLNMNGDLWEGFCERMLRHEFGWKNFTSVPHHDRGDHGIEFFTNCGVIFQCYYPDPAYSMDEHRKHVQKKINEDLKKLSEYENEIQKMLGDVKISSWVLVIPEVRTKELLKYCKTKEKKLPSLTYQAKCGISVKIETDNSFPKGSLYSRKFIGEEINIPIQKVEEAHTDIWKTDNSNFFENICRKTAKVTDVNLENLRKTLIAQYMQLEDLMDAYRDQFPDLYTQVTSIALVNLEELKNENLFVKENPKMILTSLLKRNRESIDKIEQSISRANIEAFSSGFIARWLAECKMDFIIDE